MEFEGENCNEDYPRVLLSGLHVLQEQNQLCDVVIKVGERSFNAHKVVLAAASSYFNAMFTSGFKETGQSEIKIDGNPECFELLLKFAYTSSVNMARLHDLLYDIFEMSCYMQFAEFSNSCAEEISDILQYEVSEDISLGDTLKISLLARDHGYKELAEVCDKRLAGNFEVLKDIDVFLQNATAPFLLQFLQREDLASENSEKHVSKQLHRNIL